MAMGSILWEQGAYSALEQLFRQSAEFCSEHDIWKLNVAHTFFMQVGKACCNLNLLKGAAASVVINWGAALQCRLCMPCADCTVVPLSAADIRLTTWLG
jgi:hypothetical protein